MKLTPSQAVERMRVEAYAGIYMLSAGFEKRMSTIAQQCRAISLIGTLLDHGDSHLAGRRWQGTRLQFDDRIAIIGAGAAGITAAALAVWRGCNQVHVFERDAKALGTYAGSPRLIDPRLYEWPDVDWKLDTAALPLLTWSAGTGEEVTKSLRAQWDSWIHLFGTEEAQGVRRLYWHKESALTELPELQNDAWTINIRGESYKDFRLVIVAVGFGAPKTAEYFDEPLPADVKPWNYSYWAKPPADIVGKHIAVSGRNDSGLTELIELATEFQIDGEYHPCDQPILKRLLDAIPPDETQELKRQLGLIESTLEKRLKEEMAEQQSKAERDAYVSIVEREAYDALWNVKSPSLEAFKDKRLRKRSGKVTLLIRESDLRNPARGVNAQIEEFADEHATLNSTAFLLNRFLVTQFRKWGWVDVQGAKKKYRDDLAAADVVLARHGSEQEGVINKLSRCFKDGLKQKHLERGRGFRVEIAQSPPRVGKPGEWFLYSDLYDSTTQARVLECLVAEARNHISDDPACAFRNAEKELVRLYRDRLYLDLMRHDKVIVTDTQFFDGAFFLRWVPAIQGSIESQFVRERLLIRLRNICLQQCIEEFVFRPNNTFKGFEFSALESVEGRRDAQSPSRLLKNLLDEKDKAKEVATSPNLDGLLKLLPLDDSESHLELLRQWESLRDRQKRCVEFLQTQGWDNIQPFQIGSLLWKHDQLSAVEDPAAFYNGLMESTRPIFTSMFRPAGAYRSTMYARCDALRSSDPDGAEAIRAYFDRSYNRAISRQQMATVFETVRTYRLPEYQPRDAENRQPRNPTRIIERSASTTVDFANYAQAFSDARASQDPLQLAPLGDEPVIGDNFGENIGWRALALLRGSSVQLRRIWPEEAADVGALVPAVIDEEVLSYNKDGTVRQEVLTRTEYSLDIHPR
jgi:hypothetical protein